MDALTVLRREHTRIAQLFVEFDGLPQRACLGRKAILCDLDEIVRRHISMEEALVYQRLAHASEPELATPLHGAQEHQLVLGLLDEIAAADCRDPLYAARVHLLADVLLHHIEEEEAYIFPACAAYAQVA